MTKHSNLKWLHFSFLVIALGVLVKLVFALGPFLMEGSLKLTTPEVLAGDQKDRPSSPTAAKANTPPQKDSSPAAPSGAKPEKGTGASETYAFIQQKEAELKRREDQVVSKEQYLAKMEKEVEQKLKELIAVQKEIQAYRAERDENQNGKVRSLAKIYGTMKPKEAAKLLENLDDKLVMNVISTMSSDEAAGILSNMDVKKAAKISEALCNR